MVGVEELINEEGEEGSRLGKMDGLEAVKGLFHERRLDKAEKNITLKIMKQSIHLKYYMNVCPPLTYNGVKVRK